MADKHHTQGAVELDNVFEIAQSLGYKPKLSTPSSTIVDVFQTVPATGTGDSTTPDMRYALSVNAGLQLQSKTGVVFRTEEDVNFAYSSSLDKRSVSIYETAGNVPTKYLLKKSVSVLSGTITTDTFIFTTAKKYDRIAS